MSEVFPIDQVINRTKFPGGPDQDPGIRLSWGYLPSFTFGDGVAYAHVAELTEDGEVIPSSKNAVDPVTGEVREQGDIIIVDVSVEPPKVIRAIGSFAIPTSCLVPSNALAYVPKPLG